MIALDRLQTIIPPDQALANKALSVALQQIGGVAEMTLEQLGTTAKNTETNKDLSIVSNLKNPTPPEVTNYFYNVVGAEGTGPNNTYVMTDILGLATGYIYSDQFKQIVTIMNQMDLSQLMLDLEVMLDVINGAYGISPVIIPPGTPGTGTYATRDLAVSTGLIPVTQSTISTIISTYPQQTVQLNNSWSTVVNQIDHERRVQAQANLTFNAIGNMQQAVFSFVSSLQSVYGLDTQALMSAWFLEQVATTWNLYGQSAIAVMRQGRNDVTLNESGTVSGSDVPQNPDPPYPRATLLPAYYSPSEAARMAIK